MDPVDVANRVAEELANVLAADDFDIIPDPGGGVDVATDNWSIHIEERLAFLALDDEPESETEFEAVLTKTFPAKIGRAIATADVSMSDVLTALLTASGDPFTLAFVGLLHTSRD